MAEKLTCVYVTDKGFLPCTCFSIVSLLATASIPLDVRVIYADQDDEALARARDYLAAANVTVSFATLPANAFDALARPKSLPLATYGRLLMHKVLPAGLRRVLYIDGDTLVDIDVAPLRDLNLGGMTVGAVVDIGRILVGRRLEAQQRLDLGPDGDYFNAGVLLIDWPAWCAQGIGELTLDLLATTPERFVQADQCALNFACRGRWKMLDVQWNYQPANVLYQDRERALFHFLGGRKPWIASENRHPARFIARYQRLLANSPWSDQAATTLQPLWLKDGVRLARKALPRYWSKMALYERTIERISDLTAQQEAA